MPVMKLNLHDVKKSSAREQIKTCHLSHRSANIVVHLKVFYRSYSGNSNIPHCFNETSSTNCYNQLAGFFWWRLNKAGQINLAWQGLLLFKSLTTDTILHMFNKKKISGRYWHWIQIFPDLSKRKNQRLNFISFYVQPILIS